MDFLYDINNSIILLKEKLDELVNKCPIQSKTDLKTEFGYYVESYLGIKKNDLPIADFCGIEIKCKNSNTKYPIKLFTCEFDGDGVFLSKELFEKYAKTLYEFKRSFYHYFGTCKYTYIKEKIFGKLRVDYKNQKLVLDIVSKGAVIDSKYYWTFDSINSHLVDKLSYLALIEYTDKYVNRKKCYYVKNYKIYKLKGFQDFINMIAAGKIVVYFSMDSTIDDNNNEKLHNHGIGFYIKKENIDLLFSEL